MAIAPGAPSVRERALEELSREYDSLRRRIVSYLCRRFRLDLVTSGDEADETIEQGFANIDQYDGTKPLMVWLCGIAHNLHVDHLKSAEYRYTEVEPVDLDEIPDPAGRDPAEVYEKKRQSEAVKEELSRQPKLLVDVLKLCRVEKMKPEDAAEALGISLRRLKYLLYEGAKKLRCSHRLRRLYYGTDRKPRVSRTRKGRASGDG